MIATGALRPESAHLSPENTDVRDENPQLRLECTDALHHDKRSMRVVWLFA